MSKIVKMPIADWLPYPPLLYIYIEFGLRNSGQRQKRVGQKRHKRLHFGLEFISKVFKE